ncbi:MAG: DUF4019 domain-containing protein [Bacteroidetes bacterium]|nr:DUF4019 domain-containing protein [Bacteroidota bacterium]
MTRALRSFSLLTASLLCLALLSTPAIAQDQEDQEAQDPADQTEQAREAADAWLALFDADDIEGTYETAAETFKTQVEMQDWQMQAEQVKQAVGELDGRTYMETTYADELPQAPEGDYMIVQYDTQYANLNVTEFVILVLEEDTWRMVGFNAQPQQEGQ